MKYDINYQGQRSNWDIITQDLTLEDYQNASEAIEEINEELKKYSVYGLLDRKPSTLKERLLEPLAYVVSHVVFWFLYCGTNYKIRKFKRKYPEHTF